jgi:hypothetical protein
VRCARCSLTVWRPPRGDLGIRRHRRWSVELPRTAWAPHGRSAIDCGRTLFVTPDEGCVMKKEMLINVLQPEESRIAIVEDDVLEELYVERISQGNLVGNIYKGRVVNIEPSIQAVFVDFGVGRNGFLHVSDV